MTTSLHILQTATKKLIELQQVAEWQKELLRRCPPILWFGNMTTAHPKIVTLGANPSRQEYIADSSQKAIDKLKATGDETLVCYLEPPKNRFRLLEKFETMEDVLKNSRVQEEIIHGYNTYFMNNPYKWFGKQKQNSYNVEGFLQGMEASYFGAMPYQAIHVDLFPFATISDFNTLHALANRDIFKNNWAQSIVSQLLYLLSPDILLIFGRANVRHYSEYIDASFKNVFWKKYTNAMYCIKKSNTRDLTVIGLSTNLGNPKGFTANTLKLFGKHIKQELTVN